MAEKTFNTRIQLKYDTHANWITNSNVVLKKGEVGLEVISIADATGNQIPHVLMKVGDGTSKWSALNYLHAPAADVYAWAKASEKPSYNADEIGGLADFISGEIQDTDTQYQIVDRSTSDNYVFVLQSKAKGTTTWTDVNSITVLKDKLATGSANGTVAFNGTDVAVKGLGSAAYTNSSAYDAAGAANAVLGSSSDTASTKTVYGAIAAAAAAQTTANSAKTTAEAAMPKSGGTFTGMVTLSGAPTSNLHAATKAYVDTAKSDAISTAASDATSKANQALADAKTYAEGEADQALADAKTYVDNKTAGLTGAMHFRGTVTAIPPTTGTYASGDVVLYNTKEYVYDGADWHELGDEGSHVLKTQTINGHALDGNIELTASDVGAATSTDITNAINALDVASVGGSGKYIQAISEADGKISATAAPMPTSLKNPNALTFGSKTYDGSAAVTLTASDLGAVTDISGKQDVLTFDGTYNATSNKAATVSSITSRIQALDKTDSAVAGQVVSAVSQTDGIITVTRRALIAGDIPTLEISKINGLQTALDAKTDDSSLAAIAKSGNVNDLIQTSGDVIVFNCGSSTEVI